MKDNVALILLAIPLTILIWVGARYYVNPGEPTDWTPINLERPISKEKSTSSKESDTGNGQEQEQQDEQVASDDSVEKPQVSQKQHAKNQDPSTTSAQPDDLLQVGKQNQPTTQPSNNDATQMNLGENKQTQEAHTDDAPEGEKQTNEHSTQGNSQQRAQNQSAQKSTVLLEDLFTENAADQLLFAEDAAAQETRVVDDQGEVDTPEKHTISPTAPSKQDDANSTLQLAEQTPVIEVYNNLGQEHGITAIFGSLNKTCVSEFGYATTVDVHFTTNTAAIKSNSMTELDSIIELYHNCQQAQVSIFHAVSIDSSNKSLQQRRLDEVKYHLQHMRVAKTDIVLPERL